MTVLKANCSCTPAFWRSFFFYHGIQTYFAKDTLIDLNQSHVINVVNIEGPHVIIFKIKNELSLKIFSAFANSVDPDEIPHYALFHLFLHCLPKYAIRSH